MNIHRRRLDTGLEQNSFYGKKHNTPTPVGKFSEDIIACVEKSTSYSLPSTSGMNQGYSINILNESGGMNARQYQSDVGGELGSVYQPHGRHSPNKEGLNTQKEMSSGAHIDQGQTQQGEYEHRSYGPEGSNQCSYGTFNGEQSNLLPHSSVQPHAMGYSINMNTACINQDYNHNTCAYTSHTRDVGRMSNNCHRVASASSKSTDYPRAEYLNTQTASPSARNKRQYMSCSPVDSKLQDLTSTNNGSIYVADKSNLSSAQTATSPHESLCGRQATSCSTGERSEAQTTSQERSIYERHSRNPPRKASNNGIVTSRNIKNVAENLGKGYESLALELDIEQIGIDRIKADNNNNMEQQITAMLFMWKNNAGKEATKEVLLGAIQRTKYLSRNIDPIREILR
ncbi:hypothetical protein MAR_022803 [Mya arenaria]|uniref:Death domain-containing protein n=1 Tax=Mya arenaria TaxID=6604 RepID=A0ABY7DP08_MYAAR|nr:hypothetical protein MAR_022803 [Mya arenaria]